MGNLQAGEQHHGRDCLTQGQLWSIPALERMRMGESGLSYTKWLSAQEKGWGPITGQEREEKNVSPLEDGAKSKEPDTGWRMASQRETPQKVHDVKEGEFSVEQYGRRMMEGTNKNLTEWWTWKSHDEFLLMLIKNNLKKKRAPRGSQSHP